MRFTGKIAVITAAASGIGRASAILIVEQGGTVIAIDTDDKRLEDMSSECSILKGKLSTHCIDATNEEVVTKTISEILKTNKTIDILINAIGGSTIISNPKARVDELSLNDWKGILNFNLDSMFIFTNAIVPLMKRQGGGKIVNLASIAGRGFSDVSSSAYAAAKGGVIAFTKKTARELGPFGITVNAIAPNTTLSERIRPRWEQQSPQDQVEQIEKIPLRRMAEPIDQAKVICFLASTDADYVTGQTIDVSGGLV
jgi:NAD(P)-dependent dehydrogenase (short-subunit alcohol dehydrogenase family)